MLFSGTVIFTCKDKLPNLAFKLTRLKCCPPQSVCVYGVHMCVPQDHSKTELLGRNGIFLPAPTF